MKQKMNIVRSMTLVLVLLLVTKSIDGLPWWLFTIPTVMLGFVLTIRKWLPAGFIIGAAAGFVVWLGAGLYYGVSPANGVLYKVGTLFSVPTFAIVVISGLIGGVLAGLSLYSGKCIARLISTSVSA